MQSPDLMFLQPVEDTTKLDLMETDRVGGASVRIRSSILALVGHRWFPVFGNALSGNCCEKITKLVNFSEDFA